MMNLASVELSLNELRAEADSESRRFQVAMAAFKAREASLLEQRATLLNGLDLQKVELARTVLAVSGAYSNAGMWRANDQGPYDRDEVVSDAALDIAKGGDRLRKERFATKVYDRFVGQRSDCEYGYGPRHGSINFSIGLTQEARKRQLSAEEIDAALYLLGNLVKVEAAQAAARQQAAA